MIYLATALYAEAKPFIHTLRLKQQNIPHRFQLFTSDTHALIITGTGSLAAAIADTWLLSHFLDTRYMRVDALGSRMPDFCEPDSTYSASDSFYVDCFAQIGCAGSVSDTEQYAVSVGDLYLCHKLTDAQTGHSVYPNLLYRSDFPEARLVTSPAVQTADKKPTAASRPPVLSSFRHTLKDTGRLAPVLADMEGYGGYQAAAAFLPPHRIFTWKVVSDYGSTEALTPQRISDLIKPHTDSVLSWLEQISKKTLENPSIAAAALPQPWSMLQENMPQKSIFQESTLQKSILQKRSPQESMLQRSMLLWSMAEALGYSVTQRQQLRQLLHYAALTGQSEVDLLAGLSEYITLQPPPEPPLFSFPPAQRKQEGKRILYELERRIISCSSNTPPSS